MGSPRNFLRSAFRELKPREILCNAQKCVFFPRASDTESRPQVSTTTSGVQVLSRLLSAQVSPQVVPYRSPELPFGQGVQTAWYMLDTTLAAMSGAAIVTCAPSSMKHLAVAEPIPPAPPVMKATLPSSLRTGRSVGRVRGQHRRDAQMRWNILGADLAVNFFLIPVKRTFLIAHHHT